ncbi:MAG: prolipoprotein diacylglyceryl transferase [Chloroflexi bacterium]|nr:prolipoprotein diacylglyceryl transferase [Chloroflexota bacterium]MCY3589753.1 prolipoprotein diacylglyceryl transferase [Chloroflexota bacterium]MCY3687090.1 prolipoprotein diacylglyceryl transferase [Chloroflexota bacterium]
MPELVGIINININPVLIDTGGFELTWHGLFTAVGIALGVWLAVRLARRARISEDDAMSIAVVSVVSGIIGARLLWVFEHTDQIGSVGDIFALTDGGISIYGAMIGGVLGGFTYVTFFKPNFPKWVALDVAAPGMILGQAVGRFGDFVNGEHFANASELPWAFRYTHPLTDGPWSAPGVDDWYRGSRGFEGEAPVAVHPVAGGYEPILDLMILAGLFLFRRMGVGAGWGFTFYVFAYAVVRGALSLLRTDEAAVASALSVPQLLAILTAVAAVWMALHLRRHRQPPVQTGLAVERHTHRGSRRGGLGRG